MHFLIYILLGVLVGSIVGCGAAMIIFILHNRKNAVGTLQIIESEGEETSLFLSLDTDIRYFAYEPTVTFNVSHKKVSRK